jgi:hypothetical protein
LTIPGACMWRTFGARDWEMLPTPGATEVPRLRRLESSGCPTRSHREAIMMKNEARSAAIRPAPRVSAG